MKIYFEGTLLTVNAEPEVAEAMINRLNRAMDDLIAIAQGAVAKPIAEYLED